MHCSLGDWAKFVAAHVRAGWVVTERAWGGGRVLWHNGSNTMNYAVVWMAPLKGFAALAASNLGDGTVRKACDEAVGAMIQRFLKS